MKYIIDRIEKDVVVCENDETKKMESFQIEKFPDEIKDGDIVILKNGRFIKNDTEKKNKKEKIDELMKKLMKG